jgi:hypothetical protein
VTLRLDDPYAGLLFEGGEVAGVHDLYLVMDAGARVTSLTFSAID